MHIICPKCQSGNVIRCLYSSQAQPASHGGLVSSASFAAIGASVSKMLPVPPAVGGLAGAVMGGLLGSLFEDPKPVQSVRYSHFHCMNCQHDFE